MLSPFFVFGCFQKTAPKRDTGQEGPLKKGSTKRALKRLPKSDRKKAQQKLLFPSLFNFSLVPFNRSFLK